MASWRGTCQVDRAVQRALQVEVERMGKARAKEVEQKRSPIIASNDV